MSLSGRVTLISKMGFPESITVFILVIQALSDGLSIAPSKGRDSFMNTRNKDFLSPVNRTQHRTHHSLNSNTPISQGNDDTEEYNDSLNEIQYGENNFQQKNTVENKEKRYYEKKFHQEILASLSPKNQFKDSIKTSLLPPNDKHPGLDSRKSVNSIEIISTSPEITSNTLGKRVAVMPNEYTPIPSSMKETKPFLVQETLLPVEASYSQKVPPIAPVKHSKFTHLSMPGNQNHPFPPLPNVIGESPKNEDHKHLPPVLDEEKVQGPFNVPINNFTSMSDQEPVPPLKASNDGFHDQAALPITEAPYRASVVPSGPYPAAFSILNDVPLAHTVEPLPPFRNDDSKFKPLLNISTFQYPNAPYLKKVSSGISGL